MEQNLTLSHSWFTWFCKVNITSHSLLCIIQHVLSNFIKIPDHTRKDRKDYIFTLWWIILSQIFFTSLRNKYKILLTLSLCVILIDWNNSIVYLISKYFFVNFLNFKYHKKTEMLTGSTHLTAEWKWHGYNNCFCQTWCSHRSNHIYTT